MLFFAIVASASAVQATPVDPLAPLPTVQVNHAVIVTGPARAPANPNFAGTIALSAGVTSYDVRWRRVSAADRGDPGVAAIATLARAHSPDPFVRLHFVQREVNRRITFRSDLDSWKVSDYWAQAGETLRRGEGDSEDIAILKMQALKAAGFAERDIYLSVGRDSKRGAAATLLVRVGSEFFLLDDRQEQPLPAVAGGSFEPVITLGRGRAWIHGRKFVSGDKKPATLPRGMRASLAR